MLNCFETKSSTAYFCAEQFDKPGVGGWNVAYQPGHFGSRARPFVTFSFPSATHPENEGGVRDGEGPSRSQPGRKGPN